MFNRYFQTLEAQRSVRLKVGKSGVGGAGLDLEYLEGTFDWGIYTSVRERVRRR